MHLLELYRVHLIGFDIIARQAKSDEQLVGAQMSDRIENKNVGAATGVVLDATTGAFWGSFLVGLTSLVIPGASHVPLFWGFSWLCFCFCLLGL
jgi:hypothetical protein